MDKDNDLEHDLAILIFDADTAAKLRLEDVERIAGALVTGLRSRGYTVAK